MRTIKQIKIELIRAIAGHRKAYENASDKCRMYTYKELLAEKIDLLNYLLQDIDGTDKEV